MLRRLLIVLSVLSGIALAQQPYQPSQAELDARRWFQDARFGMFLHWGVYSELGQGEWVMENRKIPIRDYEKLAPQFYPSRYDSAKWVTLAKLAGMKYITVTTRHHDGFAMFRTRQNRWNIVDATPYHQDAIRQLVDECHKQGIKIFFYYSQLDWHHPDYFPRGGTGKSAGRPESGDWNRYLDFMNAQLTELLTNYGEVGGIWFDGMWDKPNADWQLDRTYQLIHRLQPQALIIPNHHKKPLPGEDVQTFERDLPGENKSGFSGDSQIGELPLETSDTMNGAWGWNMTDNAWKSPKQLVHYLVNAAGRNANLLLNVGPMPNGEIPPEAVKALEEVGNWTSRFGASVYGTRGGPVAPQPWGVTTEKDNVLYVHVLEPATEIELPAITNVCSATRMSDQTKVSVVRSGQGSRLTIPAPTAADEFDEVLRLDRGNCH